MPLDLHAVRRAFDRAAPAYDRHAALQQEVESRLLERLEYVRQSPLRILDVGCGTGHASQRLHAQYPAADIIALDWSGAMLKLTRQRSNSLSMPIGLCADMHALPLAAHSMDVVFSNLAIAWTNDLASLFMGLRRVLRPGGMFLFTTFGPDTLCELRNAWSRVDGGPHVHPFTDMHEIGDLMVQTGFAEPVMDMEKLTLEYRDVIGLMRELKATGACNAATGRNPGLTGKEKFALALEAYDEFRTQGVYPATYEVIYGVAFGPEEGQPFRTPEGETATFSVASLRTARKQAKPAKYQHLGGLF